MTIFRAVARQERERRLKGLRRFGTDYGWSPVGVVQNLSRWPVEPLHGSWSAEAELTLAGCWDDAEATLASVLVRRRPPTARSGQTGRGDEAVLVTTLRVASTATFTASRHRRLEITASDGVPPGSPLFGELRDAPAGDRLRVGEGLALCDGELAHVGPGRGEAADLVRRLDLLGALARALDAAGG